jgi:hypothetical protein
MKKDKYHGDIMHYLLRMENHNIKVQLRGVAWREVIKAQLPEEALLRLSMEEYPDDELWLAGLKTAVRRYEEYKEDGKLRRQNGESSSRPKREERVEKKNPRPPKRYTKEKRDAYMGKAGKPKYERKPRAGDKKGKTVAPKNEVVHTDYKEAHQGIPLDVTERRRSNQACTRCGLTNHFWKHCRREQQVNTIGQRRFATNKRRRENDDRPKKRVAVVAERSQEGSSGQRSRNDRPKAWDLYDGEDL